jgi:hypothetical protein
MMTATLRPLLVLAGLAMLLAVVPLSGASARQADRLEVGSILIEIMGGNPPALVGLAVTMNPGLEKTISYPIPKLAAPETQVTVPLFIMQLTGSDDDKHPKIRAIDTLLVASNGNGPGGAALTLRITFRRADGSPAEGSGNPTIVVIAPGATALISAAATLDQ